MKTSSSSALSLCLSWRGDCAVCSCCSHFCDNHNNFPLWKYQCVGGAQFGQRAGCQPALFHWQLPSEVRMSNAGRPHHRISQRHRRIYRGDVGRWVVGKRRAGSASWDELPSRRPCSDGRTVCFTVPLKQIWLFQGFFPLILLQRTRDVFRNVSSNKQSILQRLSLWPHYERTCLTTCRRLPSNTTQSCHAHIYSVIILCRVTMLKSLLIYARIAWVMHKVNNCQPQLEQVCKTWRSYGAFIINGRLTVQNKIHIVALVAINSPLNPSAYKNYNSCTYCPSLNCNYCGRVLAKILSTNSIFFPMLTFISWHL